MKSSCTTLGFIRPCQKVYHMILKSLIFAQSCLVLSINDDIYTDFQRKLICAMTSIATMLTSATLPTANVVSLCLNTERDKNKRELLYEQYVHNRTKYTAAVVHNTQSARVNFVIFFAIELQSQRTSVTTSTATNTTNVIQNRANAVLLSNISDIQSLNFQ